MDDLEMERARELLQNLTQDESTFYVICPWNMGDFLIAGGLCHALVKKKGKPSCTIIVLDRFANCGFNFVGVSEIRYIPVDQMKILRDYICETGEYETANYFYAFFRQRSKVWGRRFIVNAKFNYMKRYKANIFGLPLDTEFIPPTITPPHNIKSNACMKRTLWIKSAR